VIGTAKLEEGWKLGREEAAHKKNALSNHVKIHLIVRGISIKQGSFHKAELEKRIFNARIKIDTSYSMQGHNI
jgi:hypothetical protein